LSEQCKKFTEEAETEASKGDHSLSAERWTNAGFCYSDAEDFAKASESFLKSADESIKAKNKAGASDSLLYAVMVTLRSGNKKQASEIIKTVDAKGLAGMESAKFAKEFLKAFETGKQDTKQSACNKFANIIADNYWLRKTLGKMGVTVSASY
jgi:Tfp pilus assembly protein PilF